VRLPASLHITSRRGSRATKDRREPPPVGPRQRHFPPMPCRSVGVRQGAKRQNDGLYVWFQPRTQIVSTETYVRDSQLRGCKSPHETRIAYTIVTGVMYPWSQFVPEYFNAGYAALPRTFGASAGTPLLHRSQTFAARFRPSEALHRNMPKRGRASERVPSTSLELVREGTAGWYVCNGGSNPARDTLSNRSVNVQICNTMQGNFPHANRNFPQGLQQKNLATSSSLKYPHRPASDR